MAQQQQSSTNNKDYQQCGGQEPAAAITAISSLRLVNTLTTTEGTSETESDFDWKSASAKERNARYESSPDQILTILGRRNVYLLLIWFETAVCWALAAMPMMASTFFMDMPCPKFDNTTAVVVDQCSKGTPASCDHLNGTLTQEFSLPLDDEGIFAIPQLTTALFLLGIIIGSIGLPRLSDRFGRQPILCISLIASGLFGCLSAIVPIVYLFMALRFFQGICFPGMCITNWVLAYESIPPSLRSYTTLVFGFWWVVGYCSIGPMAYYLPNWRWLAFAASFPSIALGLLYLNILPESFHWLASNGNEKRIQQWMDRANCFALKFGTKQALNLQIRRFCLANKQRSHPKKFGKTNNPNGQSKRLRSIAEKEDNEQQRQQHGGPSVEVSTTMTTTDGDAYGGGILVQGEVAMSEKRVWENGPTDCLPPLMAPMPINGYSTGEAVTKKSWLERSGHLVWIYTVIFAYLWSCNTFIYYGLSLFSTKLVGDVYWNYVLVGLVEIPSYMVSPFLLDKLGRKLFIAIAHLIAALTYFVIVVNDNLPRWIVPLDCPLESVTLTMWLIGKFAISCSFTSLFVYASEVFPTVSRNSSIGICAACSRIGASLVPFVKQMQRDSQLGLYGTTAFIGALATLFLPETKNKNLPASSDEVPKKSTSVERKLYK